MSKHGTIQHCSYYGKAGHNRGGCTDCKLGLLPDKDANKVRAEQDEYTVVEDVALVTKVNILFTSLIAEVNILLDNMIAILFCRNITCTQWHLLDREYNHMNLNYLMS